MTRWRRLPTGTWQFVPPPACPRCHTPWTPDRPHRPTEGYMGCWCRGIGTSHTTWTCPTCGALAAEGCTDVTQWGVANIPAGLPADARWAVEEED